MAAEHEKNPPFLQLQWRGLQTAFAYVIEELIGITFVEVGSVMENGEGYYLWKSPRRSNTEVVEYRIFAVDIAGGEGVPISFVTTVFCHPIAPTVALTMDTAGNLVVS